MKFLGSVGIFQLYLSFPDDLGCRWLKLLQREKKTLCKSEKSKSDFQQTVLEPVQLLLTSIVLCSIGTSFDVFFENSSVAQLDTEEN